MARFAGGRIVGVTIACLAMGVAIWSGREAVRMNSDFQRWLVARPMESAVDLSQPGETTVPFRQTCGTSHGEALLLQCDLDDQSVVGLEEAFRDLAAEFVVRDSNGSEIESADVNAQTVFSWDGMILLALIDPFREGEYVATLNVTSGAPALADKKQTMFVQYQLCGLEQMPAVVAGAVAVGAGVIGIVSLACVLPGLLQDGFRRRAACSDASQPD